MSAILFLFSFNLYGAGTLDRLNNIVYVTTCFLSLGAIVQFRRLVRKFSRSRNVYCTFEACSSVFVERREIQSLNDVQPNPQSLVSVTASGSGEETNKPLAQHQLIELIQSEAQGKFVQTITCVRCRITTVQKASLRWLCKRCGELVTRNECTAGCYSSKGYKLNAEVRYMRFDWLLLMINWGTDAYR